MLLKPTLIKIRMTKICLKMIHSISRSIKIPIKVKTTLNMNKSSSSLSKYCKIFLTKPRRNYVKLLGK